MCCAALAQDNPEAVPPGAPLPGDAAHVPLARPYAEGVRVIGHQWLGSRVGNEEQAWPGHCAYVASSPIGLRPLSADDRIGVAVIDVSDPRTPRWVGQLRERGALGAAETIAAVDNPGRHLLVAADYSAGNPAFAAYLHDTNQMWLVRDASGFEMLELGPALSCRFWPDAAGAPRRQR